MIEYLVASGCSQTEDGIGGLPPSLESLGGCSYVDRGDGSVADPNTWIGFVAQHLKVSSLCNLATRSYGNFYISSSLIEILTKYHYPKDRTLVCFNISDPSRMDFMCHRSHPDACSFLPYGSEMIEHSWIHHNSKTQQILEKNIGLEQAGVMSRVALTGLFSFLENQGYNYRFIMMRNYINDPDIGRCVSNNPNMIVLEPGVGIVEWAKQKNLLKDDIHPTVPGHQHIANQVIDNIKSFGK